MQQSPYTSQSASQRHVRRAAANSQESVQLPQQSRFVVSRKLPRVLELAALATSTVIYSLGGITCSMKLQKSSNATVLINRPSSCTPRRFPPYNCVRVVPRARMPLQCVCGSHIADQDSRGLGELRVWLARPAATEYQVHRVNGLILLLNIACLQL